MSDREQQVDAVSVVERFKRELGPFVIAAERTRMPMIFTNAGADGNPIVFANESFIDLTGYAREEILGSTLASLVVPGASGDLIKKIDDEYDDQSHADIEGSFRRKDGTKFVATVFVTPVLDADGAVVQHFLSMTDVTDLRDMLDALRRSESRFRLAADAANLGVIDIDLASGETHWSGKLRAILGIAEDKPASQDCYLDLVNPADRELAAKTHAVSADGEAAGGGVGAYRINRASDGDERWIESQRYASHDDTGATVRVLITNRDITDERLAQARISWAASHDSVTKLPNRSAFRAALETALRDAGSEAAVAVLLIDLDHFKHVNDLLGHQAGDEVLVEFGARLLRVVPPGATLARLGGDEFAVVLPGTDLVRASTIAQQFLEALTPAMVLRDRHIELRASVGISAYPIHARVSSQVIHCADLALYGAKRDGGGRARVFTPADRLERERQRRMLRHARIALANGWIEPFYQPQVTFATGATESFEALLRWRHPRAGLQYPATITHAFDDPGSASALGDTMADLALADMREWLAAGFAIGRLALNASAVELRDTSYPKNFLARLDHHGIPPEMLELELTETAFLGGYASTVIASLVALRAAGMRIALDDFGTGFSSLTHLRDIPVDTIKIDRSFVAGIDNSARDRAIIKGVLSVALDLGVETVAEGVETQAQASFLQAHGCTLGQGFLYAPAMSARDVRTTYG